MDRTNASWAEIGGPLPGARSPQDPSRQFPTGQHGLPREQVLAIQRERIIDAFVQLLGEDGYAAATIDEICGRAGVSTRTLYQLFKRGRDDVLVATIEIARDALFRRAALAYERAGPPREQQVRAALAVVLETLAANPPLARACIVELGAAGPVGHALILDAMRDAVDLFGQLEPFVPSALAVDELVPLLVGAIFTRIYFQVLDGRARDLPELLDSLTYLALVPFVGADSAARWMSASVRQGSPRVTVP